MEQLPSYDAAAESHSFTLDGEVPIDVRIAEIENGVLEVNVMVSEEAEQTADISEVSFDVGAPVRWTSSPDGESRQGEDGMDTDVEGSFEPGPEDQPREEVTFHLTGENGPLTIDDLNGEQFNVSLTNVGPYGGPRDGDAEVNGFVPDPNSGEALMAMLSRDWEEDDDPPNEEEQELPEDELQNPIW
jgi:hypothetical protein